MARYYLIQSMIQISTYFKDVVNPSEYIYIIIVDKELNCLIMDV